MKIPILGPLRGLAALAVCLYHFLSQIPGFIESSSIKDFFYFGHKGVQVFFIISGIVIPISMLKIDYKIQHFFKYMLKRLARLEPPYLLAVLLGALLIIVRDYVLAGDSTQVNNLSFLNFLAHIGYVVPFIDNFNWINPVFWTLAIEFQYYLFLSLFFPLITLNKKWGVWFFFILILVFPYLLSSSYFFPKWASYFGLGILYSLFILKRINVSTFFFISFILAFNVWQNQGIVDLAIASATLLIVHFYPKFSNSTGEFLGEISYSLYLLHTLIGTTIINLSMRFLGEVAITNNWLIFFIALFVSIAVAFFYWKFIEKPSQKFSKNLKIEK